MSIVCNQLNTDRESIYLILFVVGGELWIGMNDISVENTWRWISDSSLVSYFSWYSGQPNEGTAANCVLLDSSGWWWDRRCSNNHLFICEK